MRKRSFWFLSLLGCICTVESEVIESNKVSNLLGQQHQAIWLYLCLLGSINVLKRRKRTFWFLSLLGCICTVESEVIESNKVSNLLGQRISLAIWVYCFMENNPFW